MKKYLIAAVLVIVFLSLISCAPTLRLLARKILIDNTHYNVENFDGYGKDVFYETLIEEMDKGFHTLHFTSDVGFAPDGYDVFILPAPFNSYLSSERNKIYNFLDNGGTLVAMGEHGGFTNNVPINSLLTSLGVDIQFMTNTIYDNNNYYDDIYEPIISEFLDHPTTRYLDSIVLFAACSLDVFGNASVVAESSTLSTPELFESDNSNSAVSSSVDEFLNEPQVTIAVPIVAVDRIGTGKVIAIPDTNLFANDVYDGTPNIDVHDNFQFFYNILFW
ncbi:MAG: Gldg family protein [Petrotogales bacterium]